MLAQAGLVSSERNNNVNHRNYYQYGRQSARGCVASMVALAGAWARAGPRGRTALCLLAACSIYLLLPLDWQRVIGRRRLETRCEPLVRFVGVPMGEQTIRLLTWSPR